MNHSADTVVASLRLRRRNSTKSTSTRSTSRTGSVKSTRSKSLARYHSRNTVQQVDRITPPGTPSASSQDLTPHAVSYQNQFHEFLRAAYSFHPPCDESSETVTLPLNCGDVILIHCVHPTGWADGTLLDSGLRGWLPTNYCEPYEPRDVRSVLKALGQFHEVILDCGEGNLVHLQNQAYTKGLVAGVRVLLENTACLNRDAPLISPSSGLPGLRRYRKGMLGELASFLKLAEDIERNIKGVPTREVLDADCLDQLRLKAFKIIVRAVKFYDIWTEGSQVQQLLQLNSVPKLQALEDVANFVPPTPPAESVSFGDIDYSSSSVTNSDRTASPGKSHENTSPNEPGMPRSNRMSASRPMHPNVDRSSTIHRMSRTIKQSIGANLASEKLTITQEEFLAHLRNFVTITQHASSPNDVLLMTGQALHSGRQMLSIVDAIWGKSQRHFEKLGSLREQMYGQLQILVVNAGRIFDDDTGVPEDERMCPQNLRALSDDATYCTRTSGECFAVCLSALKILGDFEILGPEDAASSNKNSESITLGGEPNYVEPAPEPQHIEIVDTIGDEVQTGLPDFPMPNCHIKLPPIDTGIASFSDVTVPVSPSTPSTRGSQTSAHPQSSTELTPCTPATEMSPGCTDTETSPYELNSASSFGSLNFRDSQPESSSFTTAPTTVASTSETDLTLVETPEPKALSFHESTVLEGSAAAEFDDIENTIQTKTYAHELFLGKDGQVSGGSLPALVERLTTNDTTPDALFVTTFYLTFRIFTTPVGLAKALVERFESIGDHQRSSTPVKLRVYNVFKQWLETHWRADCDKPALDIIQVFASKQLRASLPSVGARLLELANRVSESSSALVPRTLTSMGKTSTSIVTYVPPDTPVPAAILNKNQVNLLAAWKFSGGNPHITDFEPLELARQLTIKASNLFCSILPEELLAREWSKTTGSIAVNVRAMTTLSNDLINFITDSILNSADVKKRAKVIKHWTKIGEKSLELNNYFVLMQITCALSSATVHRMKKTWEEVSSKTSGRLKKLVAITDYSRNHAAYRERLAKCTPPCVPWIGVSQTDLQMIDDGNLNMRDFVGAESLDGTKPLRAINFEKHMMTAKVISDLQRFQIPYRLQEIPELQTWLQDGLIQVRSNDSAGFTKADALYRRSCYLEPKADRNIKSERPQRADKASALPLRVFTSGLQ